jgi:hypothetical protein
MEPIRCRRGINLAIEQALEITHRLARSTFLALRYLRDTNRAVFVRLQFVSKVRCGQLEIVEDRPMILFIGYRISEKRNIFCDLDRKSVGIGQVNSFVDVVQ